jgi:hypothetical protein
VESWQEPRGNPEAHLAERFNKMMKARGWYVWNLHGNQFQKGMPDKFCTHEQYFQRFVELKPKGHKFKFTAAQKISFPLIDKCHIGIWVLVDVTEEEYRKLFQPPNWKSYLKPKEIEEIKELYPWFEHESLK